MKARPLKILFLGAMAVGKTSIVNRLMGGSFDGEYKSTLGVQLHEVDWRHGVDTQKLVLWDTDGDAEASIFSSPYARGADGAIIVCDVERPNTLDPALEIADAMQDALPGRPFIGVINKTDIMAATPEMHNALEGDCDFVAQTSALDGRGIQDALQQLVDLIHARRAD